MKDFLQNKLVKPVYQLASILVLMFLLAGAIQLTATAEYNELYPNGAWEIMAACVLFFSLVNCVFSLQSKGMVNYWRDSIFSFMGLIVLGSLMAWAFTGITLWDAGSISWILFVFTFGYLIFLSIVNIMRFVVELAQKQDGRLRGEE